MRGLEGFEPVTLAVEKGKQPGGNVLILGVGYLLKIDPGKDMVDIERELLGV